jgi:acyl-CoA thioesterase I
MKHMKRFLPLALLVLASACSVKEAACGKVETPPDQAGPTALTGDMVDPNAKPHFTIAFLGDSLTAGFGLLSSQTFPEKIEEMFKADGFTTVDTINGGVSGDTSAGGLRRVEQLLEPSVKILVVSLGGNDALRGLTVAETKENLRQIIEIAQGRGVAVMLCGMEAPTNLGEDYRTAFKDLYFDLLRSYQRQIEYVPFLLEGVAGKPELNQADGIHPNEEGSKIIAKTLFPQLRSMVERAGGS